jgi:restriction system protein
LTDKGTTIVPQELRSELKAWRADTRTRRLARQGGETEPPDDDLPEEPELSWKEQVIAELLQLSPGGFERLAQRLLREAGFINVTVTGRSHDGGIDGVGTYRPTLVSFPVYFQCKRYRGSVPSRDVRDFRGALVGRGEKGLFITTGSFTREAQKEATREGASPIELIDGQDLCDLLKDYRLGVVVTTRTVEDISIRPDFFDDFK